MSSIPFDQLVDKVTERELVYDIIERLKLGKQMVNSSGTIYHEPNDMLVDVIKKLVSLAPPDVNDNYYDIKIADIHIAAGDKSGACSFNNLTANEIVLAYSQQTQMDIKDAIKTTSTAGTMNCVFNSKVPYIHDEVIKVYAH